MSAYLVLVTVVLSTAALLGVAHLARSRRAPRDEGATVAGPTATARGAARDWQPLEARYRPALLALASTSLVLPLLLWGLALRTPGLRTGALWVGLVVVVVGVIGGLHAWRRGEAFR